MVVRSLVDRLRDPVYTGRNRCWPCTVANTALVALFGVGVGVASPAAGTLVGVLGLAAIWLRGYAVPGTPTLTRRYLPASVLRWFKRGPSGSPPSAADPTARLRALGVLRDGDDPRLTPSFRRAWADTAGALAADDGALERAAGEALSVPPADVAVGGGDGVTLTVSGDWVGQWPSRTALAADLATELTLADTGWTGLERTERADLAARIRALTEACPVCDGSTSVSEDTVESCCGPTEVVAVTCPDCSARLAEFDPSPATFAAGR